MSIEMEIVEDGIALITINRPEKRNALDEEHYRALSAAWLRVRDDAAIRVAIVTGAGDKAFSSGAASRPTHRWPCRLAKSSRSARPSCG